jgi:hypothetical protein
LNLSGSLVADQNGLVPALKERATPGVPPACLDRELREQVPHETGELARILRRHEQVEVV